MAANLITLALDSARENVIIGVPMAFENDRYHAFRDAIGGIAQYDRGIRRNIAPIDRLAAVTLRLREEKFDVDLSPDARKWLQQFSAAQMFDLQRVRERITLIDKEIRAREAEKGENTGLYAFQQLGAEWLTLKSGALLADQMGLGKEQPLSEPVLTPSGWRAIGDLVVGDDVIDADGNPTKVVGVFPQGRKRIYRITLSDGTWTRAGAEHLWLVQAIDDRRHAKSGRIMSTEEIRSSGLFFSPSSGREKGNARWFIPVMSPVRCRSRDLPVHPYVLGALIANGCLTGDHVVHSGTPEQREVLSRFLVEERVLLRKTNEHNYYLVRADDSEWPNPLRSKLKELPGVCCHSFDKSVPHAYLRSSIEQRLLLLQGLCDNDGHARSDGSATAYDTTSAQLASDVAELTRSLGGTARVSTRPPRLYEYKGELREGRLNYHVRIKLPSEFCPFLVPSKAARHQSSVRKRNIPSHSIVSIEPDGVEESVCIRVASPEHLYVTRDYIVTHNTIQLIAAIPPNIGTIVVCPASLKDNWVNEVNRWRPYLKTFVLHGRKSFRWPRPSEIVVTNYEVLPMIHDTEGVKGRKCNGLLPPKPCPGCKPDISSSGIIAVVKKRGEHLPPGPQGCPVLLEPEPCPGCHPLLDAAPEGTVLIADEAHMLKQRKAKRTQQYRALVRAVKKHGGRTWGATGTPLENHPNDLWHVLVSLGIEKEAFDTYDNFVSLFRGKPKFHADRIVGYEWPALTPEDSSRIRPLLQRVFLRRKRDEVLELPDKIYQDVEIELDRKTYVQCESFLRQNGGLEQMIAIIEKSRGESAGIQGLSSLRQALAVAKIPAMLEIVQSFEEQEEPLVVFSVHRAPIEAIADWDKKRGMKRWGIIIGGEAQHAGQIAQDFQAGKLAGIAMTLSGGVGLTLTHAANMLRVDHDWRPTMDEQVEDRLMRIGQKRNVLIKTLVANHPLEQRIMEIHAKKRGFVSASIDASAARVIDRSSPIDEEVRKLQEIAAQGGAIRRVARDAEERAIIEQLFTLVFDRKSDERIAGQLADEAQTIGLSDPQWNLARKIAARGRAKDCQNARQPDVQTAKHSEQENQ